MSTSTTITCPTCQREHALFYTQHPTHKTLNYVCDRIPRQMMTDTLEQDGKHYITELRYGMGLRQAEFVEGLDIPLKWSRRYTEQQQKKQQSTLEL